MATYKRKAMSETQEKRALRRLMDQSPEMSKMLNRLYEKFRKYQGPIDKLRAALDKEMGDKTLTQELYEMREER